MASKRSPSRASSKASAKSPSPSSSFDPSWALYGLGGLLFLGGQALFFTGRIPPGLLLSLLGLCAVGAAFMGWVPDLSSFRELVPREPAPLPKTFPSPRPKTVPNKRPSRIEPEASEGPTAMTGSGLRRSLLLGVSLLVAVFAQMNLATMSRSPWIGVSLYLAAAVLFVSALWPFRRERLYHAPLAPKAEWGLFAAIMALAAFLRVYKLDEIPSGIFFDMGFAGYGAMRILHEGFRPWVLLDIGPSFPAAPIPLYAGALWFAVFENTQFNLNLFYCVFALASFPLIYWTFRQLGGPRVALLALFILAVMRWNITFARNSFPPTMLPLFMFGTLAFLLYGLRQRKFWPFLVAGLFLPLGLYTYFSYMFFPLLVLIWALYECVVNWEGVKACRKGIMAFVVVAFLGAVPFLLPIVEKGTLGSRADSLSVLSAVKREQSLRPLIRTLVPTALMFHRQGDPNGRHNLQDHRQLDDLTGVLFVLGGAWALAGACRRKHFYTLTGLLMMAMPGLVTTDAAHSSRMHGMTPFVALACAAALAALWGRVRALWGRPGEAVFLVLLALPLGEMARQNIHTYFVVQPKSWSTWAGYSISETEIGRRFTRYGDRYECFTSPRYHDFPTINFLGYFHKEHFHMLELPDALAKNIPEGRGLLFALEDGRSGVLDYLKTLYPGGLEENALDLNGRPHVYFYRVPPEEVDKRRGLLMDLEGTREDLRIANFPKGLPEGPYRSSLKGTLFLPASGTYRFDPELDGGTLSWSIAGRPVIPGRPMEFLKGFYEVDLRLETVRKGPLTPIFAYTDATGRRRTLGPEHFHSLPADRGLKAGYYPTEDPQGEPAWSGWEPVVNYVNGNDYPFVDLRQRPFTYRWKGSLSAPESGVYRFMTRTNARATVLLDGKPVLEGGNIIGRAELTKGSHDLEVIYRTDLFNIGLMNLYWALPGAPTMEIIQNRYFGRAR